jgi:hypothetical protein
MFCRFDLWNDGFQLDAPASSSCASPITNDCQCHTTTIIVAIVVPLGVINLALVAYIIFSASRRVPMAEADFKGFN